MALVLRGLLAAACCLAAAGGALIAPAAPQDEPGAPTEPAAPALEDLAWLAGYWCGEEEGVRSEECWLPPAGGAMVGVHRDVLAPDKAFFEYLRIDAAGGGIVYHASPMGRAPTAFRLSSAKEGRAVFENPEHDYPQRIIYSLRDGGRTLHAAIEGDRGGKTARSEWVWRRGRLGDGGLPAPGAHAERPEQPAK